MLVFLDNPLIAGMTKRENLFHRGCLPSTSHISWRWCWSSQHLKGCFLQCVNIVNDALWTVSAFFTGTSRFHHETSPRVYIVSISLLLAQHTAAGKTMAASGFTVAPDTHYRLRKPNPGKHLIDALYLYAGPSTEAPRNCDSRSQPPLIPIRSLVISMKRPWNGTHQSWTVMK